MTSAIRRAGQSKASRRLAPHTKWQCRGTDSPMNVCVLVGDENTNLQNENLCVRISRRDDEKKIKCRRDGRAGGALTRAGRLSLTACLL
jgi:hypothetical protein